MAFLMVEDVKTAIQRSIRLISEKTLMDQLKKLLDHCKRVIEVNRDYMFPKYIEILYHLTILAVAQPNTRGAT